MTADTGFLMTTVDMPYLELPCVPGHKCVFHCSEGLALALKCPSKYATPQFWSWPLAVVPSSG